MENKRLPSKEQNFWNIIFSIVFVLLVFYISYKIIERNPNLITEISFFEFLIISVATFRLARLLTYDKIMFFLRDFFDKKRGIRRTIHELLTCPWCTGIWAALFVITLYLLVPLGNIFILIIAIAGVGSFIQSLANMMGRVGKK